MDPNRTTKVFDEEGLTQNTGKKRYAPINGGFSLSGGWKGLSVQAAPTLSRDQADAFGKCLRHIVRITLDGYFRLCRHLIIYIYSVQHLLKLPDAEL